MHQTLNFVLHREVDYTHSLPHANFYFTHKINNIRFVLNLASLTLKRILCLCFKTTLETVRSSQV